MSVTNIKQFKADQALAEADKRAIATVEHLEGMQRVEPFLFTFATLELFKAQQSQNAAVRRKLVPNYRVIKGEPLWGWVEDISMPQENFGTKVQVIPVSVIGCKIEEGVKNSMLKRNLVTQFLKNRLSSPSIRIAQAVLRELDKFCTISADEEMGVLTFVAKCKEWEDYVVLAVNMDLLNFMDELKEIMKSAQS